MIKQEYPYLNLITVVEGAWTALRLGTTEILEYDLQCVKQATEDLFSRSCYLGPRSHSVWRWKVITSSPFLLAVCDLGSSVLSHNTLLLDVKKIGPDRPSYLVPQFQNESSCKTFTRKWVWFAWNRTCAKNSFFYEWFRTKTCFDTEVKGSLEMVYWTNDTDMVCTYLDYHSYQPGDYFVLIILVFLIFHTQPAACVSQRRPYTLRRC